MVGHRREAPGLALHHGHYVGRGLIEGKSSVAARLSVLNGSNFWLSGPSVFEGKVVDFPSQFARMHYLADCRSQTTEAV